MPALARQGDPLESIPLTSVGKGRPVVVVRLGHPSSHERSKLMALGIMPGATVHLHQRFPSYVLGVGYTQVALDRETAGQILVADEVAPAMDPR